MFAQQEDNLHTYFEKYKKNVDLKKRRILTNLENKFIISTSAFFSYIFYLAERLIMEIIESKHIFHKLEIITLIPYTYTI